MQISVVCVKCIVLFESKISWLKLVAKLWMNHFYAVPAQLGFSQLFTANKTVWINSLHLTSAIRHLDIFLLLTSFDLCPTTSFLFLKVLKCGHLNRYSLVCLVFFLFSFFHRCLLCIYFFASPSSRQVSGNCFSAWAFRLFVIFLL